MQGSRDEKIKRDEEIRRRSGEDQEGGKDKDWDLSFHSNSFLISLLPPLTLDLDPFDGNSHVLRDSKQTLHHLILFEGEKEKNGNSIKVMNIIHWYSIKTSSAIDYHRLTRNCLSTDEYLSMICQSLTTNLPMNFSSAYKTMT